MPNRFSLALATALVLATLAMPAVLAQSRGGYRGSRPFFPGVEREHNGSPFVDHRPSEFPGAYYFSGFPLFYDDYPSDQAPSESGPQVIVMRPPTPAPDTPSQPKAAPLLIELEGDHYVRHGGAAQPFETEATHPGSVREPRAASDALRSSARQADAVSPAPLAPTVLIYRDGHQEQIPDYAIVGRILYAHNGNSAQPGYGMRSIEVSALDVPATVAANRENGINFVLPAGPNEVVTRP